MFSKEDQMWFVDMRNLISELKLEIFSLTQRVERLESNMELNTRYIE